MAVLSTKWVLYLGGYVSQFYNLLMATLVSIVSLYFKTSNFQTIVFFIADRMRPREVLFDLNVYQIND